MKTLSPNDLGKLIAVLGRLGSDNDHERAVAGMMASRLVRDRGLTWGELIRPPSLASPQPEPRPSTAADFALAARHLDRLEAWPQKFVGSLLARPSRAFSARQVAKLAEIANALRARGLT